MDAETITLFFSNLDFSSLVWQIATPFIFIFADVVSGFIQAMINNDVDSSVMRKGLLRKTLLILVIVLGVIVSLAFNIIYISTAVCLYIVIMEIISILENLSKAGIDLGKITDFLKIKKGE